MEWQNRLRRAGEAADRLLGERLGWVWPDNELGNLLDVFTVEDGKEAEGAQEERESANVDAAQTAQIKRKAEDTEEVTTDDSEGGVVGQLRGGGIERPAKRSRKDDVESGHVNHANEMESSQSQVAAGLSSPYAGSLEL